MKLITWNINSVRLRMPLLSDLANQTQADIICLQETKTPDEHFPLQAIQDLGYKHVHFSGMKSYNGVAILSKTPFEKTKIHNRVNRQDCRHISVKFGQKSLIGKPFEIHNLYIPAGGDEPDIAINDKFAHKLNFIKEITCFFENTYSKNDNLITLGDFNIAPQKHDVWSHKQLLKVVSHTPQETELLGKMQASLDWVDSARHFVPAEEKCYSWWSYRNRDWKKSNRGRRLDHIWTTKPLKQNLHSHEVLSEARDWEKPSDHAPVMIKFKK